MSLAITPGTGATPPFDGIDNGQKIVYVFGTITPSGNYVTGGDTLDWTTLGDLIKSDYIPIQCQMWSQSAANGHPGYTYYFRPGTALNNGKMQVMNGTVELAAGAYPAPILADTIAFAAAFLRV